MNFLAHFHLARPTDESRVGAILGDFAKGTAENLGKKFPAKVVDGIMLHRAIDRFTDSHPVFLRTKDLLHPSRRRLAGIVVDIFFDHFLAHHWKDYSDVPLRTFIAGIHELLENRGEWLTSELAGVVEKMKEENWLGTYGTIPGLALTFERVSQRRGFLAPLRGAERDLTNHYHSFGKAFREFYPEVVSFAASVKPGGAFNSP